MPRGPVLVVEDDRDIRDSILEILADNGYSTLAAANGKEALDFMRAADPAPSLVLLDLMMPVMDGVTFRSEQRTDPQLMNVPVVVLSAHARGEQIAAELETSGFLQKPIALDDLLEMVERFAAA
jgi:CheY-like chemotaxis protein